MRLVIFGPPGAGKGTQGRFLARHFRVPHVATGELLRLAMAENGDGELARHARVIHGGDMVSDAVANGLVFARLDAAEAKRGFILDGYPRTTAQAEALVHFLNRRGETLHAALTLSVSKETVLVRLGGRLVCGLCAASFHRHDNPPQASGLCDGCGGELIVRDDDSPAGIARRLRLYHDRTAPLADWFKKQSLLRVVSGEGHPDAVLARCLQAAGRDTAAIGEMEETLV